ncbi:hypothetical protein [Actinomadura alba]|uniref:Uncharacterized protein n=1 Tax=Actinomadura alba TaxID=406431 RepID=A0ABR7M241_9ACTN|nr:hypothetical protein [Actinomadura alba]MBC6471101.1 hypothetical protein [Actinomadura alba]
MAILGPVVVLALLMALQRLESALLPDGDEEAARHPDAPAATPEAGPFESP